jgi:hypothetical protein
MAGDGMVGNGKCGEVGKPSPEEIGVHGAIEPEEPSGKELRASVVAMKRVMIVEPRDAGR